MSLMVFAVLLGASGLRASHRIAVAVLGALLVAGVEAQFMSLLSTRAMACPFRRLRPGNPTHRDHSFRFIATGVVWGLNVPIGCFG